MFDDITRAKEGVHSVLSPSRITQAYKCPSSSHDMPKDRKSSPAAFTGTFAHAILLDYVIPDNTNVHAYVNKTIKFYVGSSTV